MDLFNKKKISEQAGEINVLKGEVQELADHLTNKGDPSDITYKGNAYTTYSGAVTEIDKKYRGVADWGIWAANIIDVRAAFIIGKGLKLIKKEKSANRELEWANEFFRINDMELYLPTVFVTEAECEGKFLGKLFWDTTPDIVFDKQSQQGMVKVRYWSWKDYKYKIEANIDDYLDYKKVKYSVEGEEKTISNKLEFVYRKFGGRISDPDDAKPKIWGSLTLIDDVDMAFRDLREIDSLFGSPVPTVEIDPKVENAAAVAKEIYDQIKNRNWKIKKTFVVTGTFSYKVPSAEGHQMIKEEIVSKLKAISGNTGIPVHFLGLPDLMSNRATAENLMELIWASTKKEREIWESAYNEILEKAMIMWNEKSQKTSLDPMKIEVKIPEITSEEWKYLTEFWLPAFIGRAITLETLLEKIPDLDVEMELKRKKAEEKANLQKIKDMGDTFDNNDPDKDKNKQDNNFDK